MSMEKNIRLPELSKTGIQDVQKKELEDACCFQVGSIGVKLEFTDHGPSLQECLTSFLKRKANGL